MPTILKLDYDTRTLPAEFRARLRIVAADVAGARVVRLRLNRSPSGRGIHARVTVTGQWSPEMVVLAQALCGSDWRRESFNARRVRGLRAVGRRLGRASLYYKSLSTRWNVLYAEKVAVAIPARDSRT